MEKKMKKKTLTSAKVFLLCIDVLKGMIQFQLEICWRKNFVCFFLFLLYKNLKDANIKE